MMFLCTGNKASSGGPEKTEIGCWGSKETAGDYSQGPKCQIHISCDLRPEIRSVILKVLGSNQNQTNRGRVFSDVSFSAESLNVPLSSGSTGLSILQESKHFWLLPCQLLDLKI